ncbi:hypothetical protein [Bacillus toyonensis]|nr:hypothetical protein [Bacillus toyonensis]
MMKAADCNFVATDIDWGGAKPLHASPFRKPWINSIEVDEIEKGFRSLK